MKFEVIKYQGKYGVQRVMDDGTTDYSCTADKEWKSTPKGCCFYDKLEDARLLKKFILDKMDTTIQVIPDDYSYNSLTPEDYHECG
jgi:hypothetical protein